jgi:hypothetical protein
MKSFGLTLSGSLELVFCMGRTILSFRIVIAQEKKE